VIGYQATTVTPANIAPSAAAVFPSIRIIPPVLSIRSTRNGSFFCSEARAYSAPAFSAPMFKSAALTFLPNCLRSAFSISPISTPRSSERTPS
jgi:hypothetical protein